MAAGSATSGWITGDLIAADVSNQFILIRNGALSEVDVKEPVVRKTRVKRQTKQPLLVGDTDPLDFQKRCREDSPGSELQNLDQPRVLLDNKPP